MDRVDAYLSRKAAETWPGAIVLLEHDGTRWVLRRPGQGDLVLSSLPPTPAERLFRVARESLSLLRRNHERAI